MANSLLEAMERMFNERLPAAGGRHNINMKTITVKNLVMKILVWVLDFMAATAMVVVVMVEGVMLILIRAVVDGVLNLIIGVEEDVDVIVMYILMMKMRFMMSMRRDLMIMKILLVTMGNLDSHMNIVVVLVMMGKILVVVAIEMNRIALLV